MTMTSNRIPQPDHADAHEPDHAADATMNFAGAHHHNFGAEHHHKPTKAILGIAMLLVLSILFYEFSGRPAHHSTAQPAAQQQTFADNRPN